MSYATTTTTLEAIQDAVTALTLPTSSSLPPGPAFDVVRSFDVEDVSKALEELLVTKSRACFIFFGGPTHENDLQGHVMFSRRVLDVTFLLTDRHFRDRQIALVGDDTTPGVLLLADILIDGLTTTLSGDIVGLPGSGRPFAIETKAHPARVCWQQEFQFHGGFKTVALPRGFAT